MKRRDYFKYTRREGSFSGASGGSPGVCGGRGEAGAATVDPPVGRRGRGSGGLSGNPTRFGPRMVGPRGILRTLILCVQNLNRWVSIELCSYEAAGLASARLCAAVSGGADPPAGPTVPELRAGFPGDEHWPAPPPPPRGACNEPRKEARPGPAPRGRPASASRWGCERTGLERAGWGGSKCALSEGTEATGRRRGWGRGLRRGRCFSLGVRGDGAPTWSAGNPTQRPPAGDGRAPPPARGRPLRAEAIPSTPPAGAGLPATPAPHAEAPRDWLRGGAPARPRTGGLRPKRLPGAAGVRRRGRGALPAAGRDVGRATPTSRLRV